MYLEKIIKVAQKLLFIIKFSTFWYYFIFVTLGFIVLQSFFNGLWTLPIIDYRVPFMGERSIFDLIYIVGLSLLFGIFVGIYSIIKKYNIGTCILSSSAGIGSFFTLLCPVCPVFFLSYLGISASVMVFTPYFWPIRIIGVIIIIVGIILLFRGVNINENIKNKLDFHSLLQNFSIIFIVLLLVTNQVMATSLVNSMINNPNSVAISGNINKDISNIVAFKRPFYADELGLDFSSIGKINKSIRKMGLMAPKQGSKPLMLTPEEMKRYVKIGTEPLITCEFCCGVKTLVGKDGTPTCGCAHSIAMRGTTAYLLQNYPDMTDEEISSEIIKQKALYFPKQMAKRLGEQLVSGEYSNDIKYIINDFSDKEIEKLKTSALKGGIQPNIQSPDMVGGC